MDARHFASAVALHLQGSGYPSAFAGGAVRDTFLGRTPKDYDVVTAALPDEVERLFSVPVLAAAGWSFAKTHTIPVGKSFGVVVVVCGALKVEVATLRNDGAYEDGRRPDTVHFITSFAEDAARRDFTMNAMFMDPLTDEVSDYHGGEADVKAGIIRAVGDADVRIAEDKLRMMRAVRFAARFGFRLEEGLERAIKRNAELISHVSPERIRQELEGILLTDNPALGLQLLMDLGLMQYVMPEMMDMISEKGDQDPKWHPEGRAWVHTKKVVTNLIGSHSILMWAGLLHDIAKPATQIRWPDGGISNHGHAELGARMARVICQRLKMSTADTSRICELILMHMKMHKANKLRLGELVNLLRRKDVDDLITLQHADSQGTDYQQRAECSCRDYLLEKRDELLPRLTDKPLVTGQVLISLGLRPGPEFRVLKDAAMIAQNEGEFGYDPDRAQDWVRDNAKRILWEAGMLSAET